MEEGQLPTLGGDIIIRHFFGPGRRALRQPEKQGEPPDSRAGQPAEPTTWVTQCARLKIWVDSVRTGGCVGQSEPSSGYISPHISRESRGDVAGPAATNISPTTPPAGPAVGPDRLFPHVVLYARQACMHHDGHGAVGGPTRGWRTGAAWLRSLPRVRDYYSIGPFGLPSVVRFCSAFH